MGTDRREGRRWRVLMLTDSLDVGGLERVVVTLTQELQARGHTITVAAEAGGALWEELPEGVGRAIAPPRLSRLDKTRYFLWLANLIRRGEFDIVHAHQRGVALQARMARTWSRTRVVEHVHNVFTPSWKSVLSFRGDRLIACGGAIAQMLERDFHRPSERITVVQNAVRDLGAGEDLTLPTSRSEVVPTVLVLARVNEQKDPHRFIDVVATLNAHEERINAVWVGDGDLLPGCLAEVERRGVKGLRFVGEQSDVAPFLRQADLVMLTSRWEGLPLTLLEAASMGRGLGAPRVGSCSEIVEHGTNGFLFDVDSTPEGIAALVDCAIDREKLRSFGQSSRSRYVSSFQLAGQVYRVEEVYRSALRP